MTPTLVLLNIAGGVCLLLWGLHNVRHSVQQVFGHHLHDFVAAGTKNRVQSFFSGLGVTLLLQSSTATALIMASLCASGIVSIPAGVAIMLGADLGTSLLAYLYFLKISWLAPLLLIAGFMLHGAFQKPGRKKYIGTLIMSLGLMLLALGWIQTAASPLAQSEVFPKILEGVERDLIMSLMLAAGLAWFTHSSLAVILLLATFMNAGMLSVVAGITMVLGANIGGAIAPILATLRDKPQAIRVPAANMIMRLTGVLVLLPFIGHLGNAFELLGLHGGDIIVAAHIGFNVILCIGFMPFVRQTASFAEKLLPEKPPASDPARPIYLDNSQIDTPGVALASATRETLRMADIVSAMLRDIVIALGQNNEAVAYHIRQRDDTVDRLYKEIKYFLTKVSQQPLDQEESEQYQRIMSFCINLEAAGDVIDKSLVDMALKKIGKNKSFSSHGWKDIQNIQRFVSQTMENAHSVFLNQNEDIAREIIKGKDWIRKAELKATDAHLDRIREGVPESINTSSLHLDIIRDFRRINSLIATVAYPVLEDAGQLRSKRLKSKKQNPKPARAS